MNYDKAHDLAHAMRESEEYKELMQAQEAVKADAEATALVRTFMAQQMQWEYARLSGTPEADELQKINVSRISAGKAGCPKAARIITAQCDFWRIQMIGV